MSNNTVNTISSPEAVKPISLTEKASVWNNRKVQQITTGLSATALIGGTIAASLLGGPIGAIIGLAVAALMALVMFIRSIVSQPNVTSVETKTPENTEPVNNTVEVVETAKVEETATTMPAPKAERFQGVKNAFASGVNFVKAHPYKTALGVAAGAAALAGAGYGAAAAYAAYTAPAPTLTQNILTAGRTLISDSRNIGSAIANTSSVKTGIEFLASGMKKGDDAIMTGLNYIANGISSAATTAGNYISTTASTVANTAAEIPVYNMIMTGNSQNATRTFANNFTNDFPNLSTVGENVIAGATVAATAIKEDATSTNGYIPTALTASFDSVKRVGQAIMETPAASTALTFIGFIAHKLRH